MSFCLLKSIARCSEEGIDSCASVLRVRELESGSDVGRSFHLDKNGNLDLIKNPDLRIINKNFLYKL